MSGQVELSENIQGMLLEFLSETNIPVGEQREGVVRLVGEIQAAIAQDRAEQTTKKPEWEERWEREPVTFLLVNALRKLSIEQLTSLRDSLSARLPDQVCPHCGKRITTKEE